MSQPQQPLLQPVLEHPALTRPSRSPIRKSPSLKKQFSVPPADADVRESIASLVENVACQSPSSPTPSENTALPESPKEDVVSKARVKLYRVWQETVQRVPVLPPLNSNCAYVLVDSSERQTFTWIGQYAPKADHAIAEKIARSIQQDDLRVKKLVLSISEGQADCEILEAFFAYFFVEEEPDYTEGSVGQPRRVEIETRTPGENTETTIFAVREQASELQLIVIGQGVRNERGSISKLTASNVFVSSETLVVESGLDVFIWVGTRVPLTLRQRASEFVKMSFSGKDVQPLRPRTEPRAFLELFKDFERIFPSATRPLTSPRRQAARMKRNVAETMHIADTEEKLYRPIAGEVERMYNERLGTNLLLQERLADCSRAIPLELVQDESGVIKSWLVHARKKVLIQVPDTRVGTLTSGDCYIILYSCKSNARHVLYIWFGSETIDSVKAAAVQNASVLIRSEPLTGTVDQVTVDQGREPAFFLAMFSFRHIPVTILWGSHGSSDLDAHVKVFEICESVVFKEDNAVVGLEIKNPVNCGLHPNKSYLVLYQPNTLDCSAKVIFIWHGLESSPSVRALAERLGLKSKPLFMPRSRRGGRRNSAVLSNGLIRHITPGAEPDDFWNMLGINKPVDLSTIPMAGSPLWQHTQNQTQIQRPVRLFEVSLFRRKNGAMFVEEIGAGGVFTQEDLLPHMCYVLDTGSLQVFAWYGASTDASSRSLVNKVVLEYIQQAHTERMSPVSVLSGFEPPDFKCCFRLWDSSRQLPGTLVPGVPELTMVFDDVGSGDQQIGRPLSASTSTTQAAVQNSLLVEGGTQLVDVMVVEAQQQQSCAEVENPQHSELEQFTAVKLKSGNVVALPRNEANKDIKHKRMISQSLQNIPPGRVQQLQAQLQGQKDSKANEIAPEGRITSFTSIGIETSSNFNSTAGVSGTQQAESNSIADTDYLNDFTFDTQGPVSPLSDACVDFMPFDQPHSAVEDRNLSSDHAAFEFRSRITHDEMPSNTLSSSILLILADQNSPRQGPISDLDVIPMGIVAKLENLYENRFTQYCDTPSGKLPNSPTVYNVAKFREAAHRQTNLYEVHTSIPSGIVAQQLQGMFRQNSTMEGDRNDFGSGSENSALIVANEGASPSTPQPSKHTYSNSSGSDARLEVDDHDLHRETNIEDNWGFSFQERLSESSDVHHHERLSDSMSHIEEDEVARNRQFLASHVEDLSGIPTGSRVSWRKRRTHTRGSSFTSVGSTATSAAERLFGTLGELPAHGKVGSGDSEFDQLIEGTEFEIDETNDDKPACDLGYDGISYADNLSEPQQAENLDKHDIVDRDSLTFGSESEYGNIEPGDHIEPTLASIVEAERAKEKPPGGYVRSLSGKFFSILKESRLERRSSETIQAIPKGMVQEISSLLQAQKETETNRKSARQSKTGSVRVMEASSDEPSPHAQIMTTTIVDSDEPEREKQTATTTTLDLVVEQPRARTRSKSFDVSMEQNMYPLQLEEPSANPSSASLPDQTDAITVRSTDKIPRRRSFQPQSLTISQTSSAAVVPFSKGSIQPLPASKPETPTAKALKEALTQHFFSTPPSVHGDDRRVPNDSVLLAAPTTTDSPVHPSKQPSIRKSLPPTNEPTRPPVVISATKQPPPDRTKRHRGQLQHEMESITLPGKAPSLPVTQNLNAAPGSLPVVTNIPNTVSVKVETSSSSSAQPTMVATSPASVPVSINSSLQASVALESNKELTGNRKTNDPVVVTARSTTAIPFAGGPSTKTPIQVPKSSTVVLPSMAAATNAPTLNFGSKGTSEPASITQSAAGNGSVEAPSEDDDMDSYRRHESSVESESDTNTSVPASSRQGSRRPSTESVETSRGNRRGHRGTRARRSFVSEVANAVELHQKLNDGKTNQKETGKVRSEMPYKEEYTNTKAVQKESGTPTPDISSAHSDDRHSVEAVADPKTQSWLQELHTIDPHLKFPAQRGGTDHSEKRSPKKEKSVPVVTSNSVAAIEPAPSATRRNSVALSTIMHAVGELDKNSTLSTTKNPNSAPISKVPPKLSIRPFHLSAAQNSFKSVNSQEPTPVTHVQATKALSFDENVSDEGHRPTSVGIDVTSWLSELRGMGATISEPGQLKMPSTGSSSAPKPPTRPRSSSIASSIFSGEEQPVARILRTPSIISISSSIPYDPRHKDPPSPTASHMSILEYEDAPGVSTDRLETMSASVKSDASYHRRQKTENLWLKELLGMGAVVDTSLIDKERQRYAPKESSLDRIPENRAGATLPESIVETVEAGGSDEEVEEKSGALPHKSKIRRTSPIFELAGASQTLESDYLAALTEVEKENDTEDQSQLISHTLENSVSIEQQDIHKILPSKPDEHTSDRRNRSQRRKQRSSRRESPEVDTDCVVVHNIAGTAHQVATRLPSKSFTHMRSEISPADHHYVDKALTQILHNKRDTPRGPFDEANDLSKFVRQLAVPRDTIQLSPRTEAVGWWCVNQYEQELEARLVPLIRAKHSQLSQIMRT